MKKLGIYVIVSFLVISGFVTFKEPGWTIEHFMDVSFIVGLVLLLLGLLIWVVRGGFFDIFHSSMRMLFNFGPNRRSAEEIREAGTLSELVAVKYHHLLIVGGIYIVVNILFLVIFY